MKNRRLGSVLFACAMLLLAGMNSSEVQARQRGFFYAPFLLRGLASITDRPGANDTTHHARDGSLASFGATRRNHTNDNRWRLQYRADRRVFSTR
jgi:hypothetical protein